MKDDNLNRIINIVRILKEEGMSVGASTNVTNQPGQPIAIAGLPPDTPPVRKRYIYPKLVRGYRSIWKKR
jgi:hypothetical protein